MEGSKSTPVSNGVPPLSRISYVLSKNKQTLFNHIAKLFRLSLVSHLVEFVLTGPTIGKRTIGGERGGKGVEGEGGTILQPARKVYDFQSVNSTSTRDYSESCHANMSPAFASELRVKKCAQNLAREGGIRQRQKTFST